MRLRIAKNNADLFAFRTLTMFQYVTLYGNSFWKFLTLIFTVEYLLYCSKFILYIEIQLFQVASAM